MRKNRESEPLAGEAINRTGENGHAVEVDQVINVNKEEKEMKKENLTEHLQSGEREDTGSCSYPFPTIAELLKRRLAGVEYQKRLPYTDIDYATYNWSVTQGCSKHSEGCRELL